MIPDVAGQRRRHLRASASASVAKSHFRLDRADRSHPVAAEMDPDDAVLDAAASCPMEAIRVVDVATGELLEA